MRTIASNPYGASAILLLLAVLLVGTASALAQTKASAPAAGEEPTQLVVKLASDVIEAVRADKAVQSGDLAAMQRLVEERILPYVDFEKTTQLSVGRAWRQATPEQRVQLTSEFRTLLIRTYAGALATVREYNVRVVLTRTEGDGEVVVRTSVIGRRGDPIQVDYRLEKTGAGWKIYDICVLGVWLVPTYQTSFMNEISQGGIERLIASLAARNRQNAAQGQS
jgi:phospholipid transport system substrate-binding protein